MSIEPHPLDYDWRFVESTVDKLIFLSEGLSVLTCGAPSVATKLRSLARQVTSVDRNPLQFPDNRVDINREDPLKTSARSIIVDPPWYPKEFYRWITWAAQHSTSDSLILASMWPESVRPTAREERSHLLKWIDEWADVDILHDFLEYQVPYFERESRSVLGMDNPGLPWRKGDLLKIRPRKIPPLSHPLGFSSVWARFVWNDYQLALRVSDISTDVPTIRKLDTACVWTFPSVSRRAKDRDLIDLWSSRNEVASVSCSKGLEEDLIRFTEFRGVCEKKSVGLEKIISEWGIPAGPFERVCSWNHYD